MNVETDMTITRQLFWLMALAIPIACVARTLVYEEVFREARDFCVHKSRSCRTLAARKFFYLFTCDYCLTHWVALLFIALTGFRLLIADWRGYVLAFFALVLVANFYLNLYARLKVDITNEKKDIEQKEKQIEQLQTKASRSPPSDQEHEPESSTAL